MTLVSLKAKFLNDTRGRRAVGVIMDCPCGNRDPDHRLFVPFDVALDGSPRPPDEKAWARTGDTIETLTLSPSVQRLEACKWHGWIRNGEAVTA